MHILPIHITCYFLKVKHTDFENFYFRNLVLPGLKWYKFSSLDDKTTLSLFIEDVDKKTKKKSETYTHRGRVYKHTRRSIKHEPLVGHRNFWDRNFGKKQQVTWDQFQHSFQQEFKTEISELYKSDESSEWLFNVIKNDVFKATDMVTKDNYLEIIGGTEHGKDIWKIVIEKATEKYCIKEVFNMKSTVRLTAVENLGKQVLDFCDCMPAYVIIFSKQ